MKLQLLLFMFLISAGILNAQDTIRTLIISEARSYSQFNSYVELTNMGEEPVDLSQFKFGVMRHASTPIYDVWNDPWVPEANKFYMLPKVILQPGKSWVQTTAYDFGPEQYRKKIPGFEDQERWKQTEMYELADYLIHMAEKNGDETDSVTTTTNPTYGENYDETWRIQEGWHAFYIEQHLSETDSVVIDQVIGVFDNNGVNFQRAYDVAGVKDATANSILVRKHSVKNGNLDFANARGVGLEDSEWIPIPAPGYKFRDVYWTVGNHGDYNLDENKLVSNEVDIDFANKVITVPWGTRRGDGIMRKIEKTPGVAWQYILNSNFEDSLSFAAHTDDKLAVYVCGDDLDFAEFSIVVAEPNADNNIVVPVSNWERDGGWRDDNERGILNWPRVTEHESGPDTITGTWFGIPYATRTDSLLERLEKATNATWEFEWVDGVERPDLKDGDQLFVTAENGDVKKYHIQVQPFNPSHNAYLSAITWPDIPDFYRGIFGWMGDTIPSFNSTTYNYTVQIPFDVEGVPALVYKKDDLNSTVEVKRATNLNGTKEQRTVEFVVTAEDDSVTHTYRVVMIKDKPSDKVQPFTPEPFLSEYIYNEQWANGFAEIKNPGNQPLDLSNYMIAMHWQSNPANIISLRSNPGDWLWRYNKYVPGYKWVNEAQWAVTPAILESDLSVNAIVEPGDVFVIGSIVRDRFTWYDYMDQDYVWPVPQQVDVQFSNFVGDYGTYKNHWNEEVGNNGLPVGLAKSSSWYLFKILNDSIKRGLKPATDPKDFELIETFSMTGGGNWVIGGKAVPGPNGYKRKPHIWQPNPEFEGSFGTNWEDSEWTMEDRAYWQARNVGYPYEILNIGNDLGQHYMEQPTHWMSTISSVFYKVSDGYSMNEQIIGAKTGTTVAEFLGGITKANDMQTLTAMRGDAELAMSDALLNNDMLVVLSADSANTTKYMLSVTEEGLSSNAVLTSDRYTITIDVQPKSAGNENAGMGSVTGFDYGTSLRTVLANITVPLGANMSVINGEGAYVPLKTLNFDTAYVNVTVNDNIYLDVVAENGMTEIVYQLIPSGTEKDAFILSDIYSVNQKEILIGLVPRGTSVSTLLSNLVASSGGTMKVVNKMGQQRLDGGVADDDKVVVTSANGQVSKAYFISKLASEATPEAKYLAYILSNSYMVDQVMFKVDGVAGDEAVESFLSNVTPAAGATAVVVDMNGANKNSGDIDKEDMVKVTSADGKIMVYYTFGTLTSVGKVNDNNIALYPNPTNSEINVSGVKAGYRIQVYNSVGSAIRDINVQSSIERISLKSQPAGMYMIVVSDKSKLLGSFKALKK